jgi:hypothetical protein
MAERVSDRRAVRAVLLAAAAAALALLAGCTLAAPTATPATHHPAATSPATSPATPAASSAPAPGPTAAFIDAGASGVRVQAGDDWTLPDWVRPASDSGFFSEVATPKAHVELHSVDVSWRQVQPTQGGALDRTRDGEVQDMHFDGLDSQLAQPGDFWMRLFASGKSWAPAWVAADCHVKTYGPDYDGQRHLPIWNECVWTHLMATYRSLYIDTGLAADPRLRFIYVPGAFTWSEFDYDIIAAAVQTGDLDKKSYLSWYSHAWTDLVSLFGADATKLVFTGEDYPFGPFGAAENLLAAKAVDAGMGIRTGITELSNFHLSEAPAYGSHIQPNGHLVVDESLPIHSGRYVVATENECYTDCGYTTKDPYYAVRQSNLKALQLRMNWMYVVPGPSYFDAYPEQWDWVRLSLGQTASTSADAWAELRDAEDSYWDDGPPASLKKGDWPTRPYVRNLERWIVQVDVPGSVAHRTDVDVHRKVLEADNGTAWEGLSTGIAVGDTGFALDVEPRFAVAAATSRVVLKVTYLDRGTGSFAVDSAAGSSAQVPLTGSGQWMTATVALPSGALAGSGGVAPRLRIALAHGSSDLVVRFVRLVRGDR